ncbi:hypothetical protein V8G54_027914, partial [Vigna mungo]
ASAGTVTVRVTPMRIVRGKAVVGSRIRCMANPRRVQMVAKQIRRELSDMLLTDKVLQYAILPETSLGADRYLSSLSTVTDVQVSGDLQVVKVFVSVFRDERGREVAIAGLKSKAKYVPSELGKRMKLRLTPEIRFIEDDSFEKGSRVCVLTCVFVTVQLQDTLVFLVHLFLSSVKQSEVCINWYIIFWIFDLGDGGVPWTLNLHFLFHQ